MTRLSVVTVLYRSADVLAKTLPTWVDSARCGGVEFVFVDHAPADGCREVIAESLGDNGFRYLPDASNPGFAAGCNRGVAAATAPYVLLLNPDVWLAADSLSLVLQGIGAAPVAVGLRMRDNEFTGIDVHPVALFVDRPVGTRCGPLGPSCGAALFPVPLYQRFGGLYEPLFAWGEDADLAFRLYAAGVRTRALDLGLPHAWGHSVEGDETLSRLRAYLLARNRLLVAARTFSWPLLVLALPALVLGHVGLGVRRARQGLLGPFLRGVGRGLLGALPARRTWRGSRFGLGSLARYRTGDR